MQHFSDHFDKVILVHSRIQIVHIILKKKEQIKMSVSLNVFVKKGYVRKRASLRKRKQWRKTKHPIGKDPGIELQETATCRMARNLICMSDLQLITNATTYKDMFSYLCNLLSIKTNNEADTLLRCSIPILNPHKRVQYTSMQTCYPYQFGAVTTPRFI